MHMELMCLYIKSPTSRIPFISLNGSLHLYVKYVKITNVLKVFISQPASQLLKAMLFCCFKQHMYCMQYLFGTCSFSKHQVFLSANQ